MINTKHLDSLLAIAQHGSFSAAGQAVGRSHSAISLHIKALEEDLSTRLVDRTQRPPVLTPDGEALAEQARRLHRVLGDINAIGQGDNLAGTLAVGIVPTAMAHLAAPAMAGLRARHPDLRLEIRTGLSGELAQSVQAADLDAALLTGPDLTPEDLVLHKVVEEPLVVIAPPGTTAQSDAELLVSHPFIWFSRKTWAGQQIERRLLDRGLNVSHSTEVDSLEAIEALVRHGLGVSVVPWRGTAQDLFVIPFGQPQASRRLMLTARRRTPKTRLIKALLDALRAIQST
ncbi:MAG: LysR family transcriptional regulator [Pseudomonadota bacterium]